MGKTNEEMVDIYIFEKEGIGRSVDPLSSIQQCISPKEILGMIYSAYANATYTDDIVPPEYYDNVIDNKYSSAWTIHEIILVMYYKESRDSAKYARVLTYLLMIFIITIPLHKMIYTSLKTFFNNRQTFQFIERTEDDPDVWLKKVETDREESTYHNLIFNKFGEVRKVKTSSNIASGHAIKGSRIKCPNEHSTSRLLNRTELNKEFDRDGYIGTKEQKFRRSLRQELGDAAKEDKRYIASTARSQRFVTSQLNDDVSFYEPVSSDESISLSSN